ncbi:MAG TPA: HEAT repeat domain-containing protein [Planctomycetota bacterium]|nr:HEAT repeat domain-containing protein [Planctomycetota bacterium]
MNAVLLMVGVILGGDGAALRGAVGRELQAESPAERAGALKKLAGTSQEKTILVIAASLKDKELEVRKAAAEALEASTDGAGVAIPRLVEILVDKKEDLNLRLACAKALVKSRYKSEVFPYLLKTMSSIDSEERQFHKFGYEVTVLLDGYVGKSYGADKVTCERWEEWWTDNQAALKKEDAKAHERWKTEGK